MLGLGLCQVRLCLGQVRFWLGEVWVRFGLGQVWVRFVLCQVLVRLGLVQVRFGLGWDWVRFGFGSVDDSFLGFLRVFLGFLHALQVCLPRPDSDLRPREDPCKIRKHNIKKSIRQQSERRLTRYQFVQKTYAKIKRLVVFAIVSMFGGLQQSEC